MGFAYDHLIFDLDDTLLDTYGQLVEPAAREACAAMIAAGLVTDLETCLSERRRLFREQPRADVHALLADHFNAADKAAVTAAGNRAYFERDLQPPLLLEPEVGELLEQMSDHYRLHLVTAGHPPTQQRKVSLLGIEPHFTAIRYVDRGKAETKDQALSELHHRFGGSATRYLCIGDRADSEIRAANRLGMTTCRVRRGEFAHLAPQSPEEQADINVTHVVELKSHLF